jgi:hypothetical protein
MRRLLLICAGATVFAASFFMTLFILDMSPVAAAKSDGAKGLVIALEKYRSLRGIYPIFGNRDVPLSELERPLVAAGVMAALPANDWIKASRYVATDGKAYGLLIGKTPPCIVEVNISNSTWWGQPAACSEF